MHFLSWKFVYFDSNFTELFFLGVQLKKNPSFKQWNIRENHSLRNKLAQKLYDEYVWHLNISKPSVIQLFVHLTRFFIFILVKFYCFTRSFGPSIEAKSMVLEFATRDSEHCFWFLLSRGWPLCLPHLCMFTWFCTMWCLSPNNTSFWKYLKFNSWKHNDKQFI